MAENFKKEQKQQAEIKKEEQQVSQEHSIETFFMVLPTGEAEIHAKDNKGNLLEVEFIEPGELTSEEVKKIESVEQSVISEMSGLDIINKGEKAAAAIEKTDIIAKDVLGVASSLEDYSHKILKVVPESIKNPSIPLEGQHYLITLADSPQIKNELAKRGYNIEEIDDSAFRAYKESSDLVMIYAAEKG
jgi:hypothetical protein